MSKRLLFTILVLSMFIVTVTWIPTIPMANNNDSAVRTQDDSSPMTNNQDKLIPLEEIDYPRPSVFHLADDAPADGVLDPVVVEQSGFAASENISARTDSYQNL
ncbi:MAG: hypothetical protein ACW98J_09485, partial [Candidatus Thorarchaeota archaeon]